MSGSPIFAATLTPYRSLSPRGLCMLIAVIAILASIPAIVFSRLGAWPIVGFMGLDVLLVWWALSASMKSGREAEHVALYRDALEVTRVSQEGSEQIEHFDPFYVRLEVERDEEDRVTALLLRERGERVPLGQFLNPADKASFARAFGQALRTVRG